MVAGVHPGVNASETPESITLRVLAALSVHDLPHPLRRHAPAGVRLTHPPQGMTADVAIVESEAPCVIKRCANPVYLDWLRREHDVLRALEGSALPVPRALDYRDEGGIVWLVMTRLDGVPLLAELRIIGATQRRRRLKTLGRLLRRLHATPIPSALRSDTPWIDRMLAQAEHNLPWCDGTPELLADLRGRRPEPVAEMLIHGDLALDNVLAGPGDALSLIDWAGGGQGDPRHDIALALKNEDLGGADLAAFGEGYGSPPSDEATRQWFVNLYDFY